MDSLIKKNDELEIKLNKKTLSYDELQDKFQAITQEVLDLKQEKMFYENFSNLTEEEKTSAEKAHKEIEEKYNQKTQEVLESEQEKMFLEKTLELEEKAKHAATKKYYKAIIFSAIAITVIAGGYSIMFAEIAGQQYRVQIEPQTTGYTI
ncbi:MAG: hypothetical protein IH795_09505, partial [Bacteroidetes bacterium]|nr:hypothetical protein [Bacteroidota bacterium]